MNKIILTILLISSSFKIQCDQFEDLKKPSNLFKYDETINQITTKIENIIIERYHGKVLVGDERMVHWFDEPALQFEVIGPLSKDNLRLILTDIANEFVDLINKNLKNTINLNKKLYSIKDVSVAILVINNKHKWVYHPDILSASLDQSKFYFHTVDEKNIYKYKTTEIEDYETALKIVEEKKIDDNFFMRCYHFLFGE